MEIPLTYEKEDDHIALIDCEGNVIYEDGYGPDGIIDEDMFEEDDIDDFD